MPTVCQQRALAAVVAVCPQPSPLGRRPERTYAQLVVGERSQWNQPGRAGHRRHDESHERVDDSPCQELAEGARIASVGAAQVL